MCHASSWQLRTLVPALWSWFVARLLVRGRAKLGRGRTILVRDRTMLVRGRTKLVDVCTML